MNKIVLFFILILFFSFVKAEVVLKTEINFKQSGNAEINNVKLMEGIPYEENKNGLFEVKTLNKDNQKISAVKVFVSFYSPELFGEITELIQEINIPWTGTEKYLVVEFKGKEILRNEIALTICNGNFVCEKNESFLSCPKDCPLNQKDEICLNQTDGICDPDCLIGVDKDCEKQKEIKNALKKEKPRDNFIFWLLGIGFVLTLVFLFLGSRENIKTNI